MKHICVIVGSFKSLPAKANVGLSSRTNHDFAICNGFQIVTDRAKAVNWIATWLEVSLSYKPFSHI